MIPFTKMAGCGNDFVVIDAAAVPPGLGLEALGRAVCAPGTGVGADGLVALDPAPAGEAAYTVRIINRSGLPAEMCGNAARCIARLAVDRGIAPPEHAFLTDAGLVRAVVGRDAAGEVTISLALPAPSPLRRDVAIEVDGTTFRLDVIDVGVPHAVLWWPEIEAAPVATLGKALRHHSAFPAGANINFAAPRGDLIRVRTFERGVEAETLACGTGSTAVAIAAVARGLAVPPVRILTTHGAVLTIGLHLAGDVAAGLVLSGPATTVFEARLTDEWLAEAFPA